MNNFFTCVDYGKKANRFLAKCGVKDEPFPADFAQLLVDSSYELWNLYKDNVEVYLHILKKIEDGFDSVSIVTNLIEKMMEEDILVAIENNNCYLTSAKKIYINDDKVYQQIFDPVVAPESLGILYKVHVLKMCSFSVKDYFFI